MKLAIVVAALASSSLTALAGEPDAGVALGLPGPARNLALSALAAARRAVDQADAADDQRAQAREKLADAETLFSSGRYPESAKAADVAWQLVSASAKEPTRFAVQVQESGATSVRSRSGRPIRVEAEGVAQSLYAGQGLKIEKGHAPGSPADDEGLMAPTLLGPPHDTRLLAGGAPIGLHWRAVKSATTYEVTLAGPKASTLKTQKPKVWLPPLPVGRYTWSVRAWSGETPSEPSATRSFELADSAVKLEVGKTKWK